MRTLEFQLAELFTNLRRNGILTVAAVVTVMASLVVFGVLWLIDLNVQHLLEDQARRAQISAYVARGMSNEQQAQVRERILAVPGVAACEYVSSEQAWERLKKDLQSDVLEVLEGKSRLPAKFSVRPHDPAAIEQVAEQLKAVEGVQDVQYGRQVVTKLNDLVPQFRRVGWAVLGLFSLATCAIISNAIRLTIYARRREIRIMQLVGATDGFVRTPFVLEGVFHGMVGGLLAVGATSILYNLLGQANAVLNPWLKLIALAELMPGFALGLVLLGVLFGVGGSLLSMRSFLRES